MKPVIKWTGSKRAIAEQIMGYVNFTPNNYFSPFIGGGSDLYILNQKFENIKSFASDINTDLISLWNVIKNTPDKLINDYSEKWEKLNKDNNFFYEVRKNYNENKNPFDLFFLSRTSINGLIRYNKNGDFNASFHITRKGIKPETIKEIISDWSENIKYTDFQKRNYIEIIDDVKSGDLVYLDPPYENTDGMYFGGINQKELFSFLYKLNEKDVNWMMSYDGSETATIPTDVFKQHIIIDYGHSSFSNIRKQELIKVIDSLYLNF